MAIEFCSEKSVDIRVSPRISFSYDFCQSDIVVPAASEEEEQEHPLRSNSNIEFDFCVRESFELESSSADELFSDGKLIPTEIKKKTTTTTTTTTSSVSPRHQVDLHQQGVVIPQPPLPPPPPPPPPQARGLPDDDDDNNNSKSLKKDNEAYDKQSSKSFWSFKRSSSCGNGYGRSLCPLPLLSRSNSTGSADSKPIAAKRSSTLSKDVKHNSQRNTRLSSQSSSSSSSSNSYQKPPLLKKGGHHHHHHHHHHGSYTNGVSINPVLNVPPANLFGLGSIFSNGKEKGKKK